MLHFGDLALMSQQQVSGLATAVVKLLDKVVHACNFGAASTASLAMRVMM